MEDITMAIMAVVVLLIFMVSWDRWLEKLFIKFMNKLDEWKNGETVGIMIDPHGLGPTLWWTLKNSKIRYFKSGKNITEEEYYKTARFYLEIPTEGKDLSISK